VSGVFDAIRTFFDHLRGVAWQPVLLALVCQTAKMLARTRAWRNVLAAAYPDSRVRWRSVFGAYAAGAGVNAVLPARGGDFLKLYLVKHRVEGATYPTLGASLLVDGLVDLALSAALIVWALLHHVLPGVRVVRRLPSVDWFWLFHDSRRALIVAAVALVVGFVLGAFASRKIADVGRRLAQGVTILRTPGVWVRRVVVWQLVDWALRLATIYFFLRAFHIHAGLENALRVQVTQSLSTILPLTPAGIGTEQALAVYVLAGQASRTTIVSFSVGMELILTAWNVVLGAAAMLLMLRSLRWRRLVRPDEAAADAGSGD
jgi:uncharacterized membrane protein YbhN (UPF0104 family)